MNNFKKSLKSFVDKINNFLIKLTPLKVLYFFLGIVATLIATHLITFKIGCCDMTRSWGWFNLDAEYMVPSVFSALLFLSFSLTLFLFAANSFFYKDRKFFIRWLILGLVFGFLAYDDYFQVHETWMMTLRDQLGASGFLYFAWVVPYSIFCAVLFFGYISMFWSFPRKNLLLFGLSAAIYFTGVFIVEMLGANYFDTHMDKYLIPKDNIYFAYVTVEQSLQLIGMVFFQFALFSYFKDIYKNAIENKTDKTIKSKLKKHAK